jgi:hypothetical protein
VARTWLELRVDLLAGGALCGGSFDRRPLLASNVVRW